MNRSLAITLMAIGVILLIVGVLQHYVLKLGVLHLSIIAGVIGVLILIVGAAGTMMRKPA